MAKHHEPLKALAPIDWAEVPQEDGGLDGFLNGVFAEAQVVVDSIPSTTTTTSGSNSTTATGRARAQTDSAVFYSGAAAAAATAKDQSPSSSAGPSAEQREQLRKEWKEVKVNPRDNPLGITVYKLAGKDGRGAWFARRSVHEGLSFDRWKAGLEREFAETMKVQGSPGSGNIRGIGADRSVEHKVLDGAGHLNVFQLSAQFPGPTSPRDFITLLLTTDTIPGRPPPSQEQQKKQHGPRPLRQYMIVSKPCTHPGCPPRQGIIRGQYESVEIIREVPGESMAGKRSFSHADLTSDDATRRVSFAKPPAEGDHDGGDGEDGPRAVEWLMVTRSDPGGSVPRFMIEKGTPPGIVGDAGKFLKWVTAMDPSKESEPGAVQHNGEKQHLSPADARNRPSNQQHVNAANRTQDEAGTGGDDDDEGIPSSNGIYGIIAGAFGAATSVAYGLRQQFSSPLGFSTSQESVAEDQTKQEGAEGDDDNGSESDASSTHSFSSAMERYMTADMGGGDSINGSHSSESRSQSKTNGNNNNNPLEKELLKLTERRRKLDENYAKMQERLESRRQGDKDKDAAALAKAREKHDRELAKQEAKYRREMRKLEEKREHEERKAEARRRKTLEREEKSSLQLELDRARADRDVARKQLELLQGQVGELQRENTMLVARLGRLGAINREDSASSRELSIKSLGKSDRAASS
ncbi:START-like domain-containingprotein [Purpureocillium lilacinum]|uniref:START-like domain-containingprotein n=1 Tax=Purpureocillium lilacinum TaxID=33203 RepID=A0A179HNP1_PURLI|nr:START-like domain-containingprotein [Purpureocillium lilacinum]KAK4091245.1 hypothetical protein Purlil1_4259 [Purpureocillium lilacinum]OAQ84503.1 START-like domain-containingprotein [Purpureocillium lilacinum]OAQ91288.1 START-like domain-containingprotein [Purpureocillium lilacinum]GJN68773.1 SNF1-interacting protein [Purpureocillium lilacinum]GJN77550.1 SNF1-interacting protein [Purpureocillium lilacinum]